MIRTVGYMLNHLLPLVSSPWLYLIVFAAVAVDGFLPVIPIEALVIGLGALTATGKPSLLALGAAVTLGGMAGDRVTYFLGRKAGGRLRHRRLMAAKVRAERALLRYGGTAIVIGRFLPWGRAATSMTAGSVSMPMGRYALFTGLSSAAWAAYTIGLGRLGGATFAGNPLLGAAFGMALGLLLGAAHLIGGLISGKKRVQPAPGDSVRRPRVDHDLVGLAGPVEMLVERKRDTRRDDLAGPAEQHGHRTPGPASSLTARPAQPTRNVPDMKTTSSTACSATPTASTVRSTTGRAPIRASTSTTATASSA